jgi:hypothetical protein
VIAEHVAPDDVGVLEALAHLVQGAQERHYLLVDGKERVLDSEHLFLQYQLELPEGRGY